MPISPAQNPPPYTVTYDAGNRAVGTMDTFRVIDANGAAMVSIPTYFDDRTQDFLNLAVDALNVAYAATQVSSPPKSTTPASQTGQKDVGTTTAPTATDSSDK